MGKVFGWIFLESTGSIAPSCFKMFLSNQTIQWWSCPTLWWAVPKSIFQFIFPKVWVCCFQKVWVCTLHLVVPFFFSAWVHGHHHSHWIHHRFLFFFRGGDPNFHWFTDYTNGPVITGHTVIVRNLHPNPFAFFWCRQVPAKKKLLARSVSGRTTSHRWECVYGWWGEKGSYSNYA